MATGFCEVNCIEYTEGVDLSNDILYIANPNGLNGSVVDRDILESFFDVEYVIVDESYEDFCRPTCFSYRSGMPVTTFSYVKLLASLLQPSWSSFRLLFWSP